VLPDIEELMGQDSGERDFGSPRWRYVALAAVVFAVSGALLVLLWQVPRLLPQPVLPTVTPRPLATWTVIPLPTAVPASPIPPTPTLEVRDPTITDAKAVVDDASGWIDFHLDARVPPERDIAEVVLWYDTIAGRGARLLDGPWSDKATAVYRLDATLEGLTRTMTNTHQIDYWWLVRDTSGQSVRAGGIADLGPNLQSLVITPTPEPPPLDFSWGVSATQHYQFHYVPGTAAERDRFQLGNLAEASLARISSQLDLDYEDRMSIYLVPRVFWQGGAAYADKVQLISYLDRNYTGIETWSYFTHEGTHALAQDLLQPKENGGGPDGVLVEGLAVWASGGHYRLEPLDAWAAVVAASDEYLPLSDLRSGPFYDFQHETSYLEGGSFVKFLIERHSLETLKELYGRATGEAEHDEALVRELYGKGYDELEAEWLGQLSGVEPTAGEAETWWLKVRSFDLMRRYETELDPDARLLPGSAPPEWTSDTLQIYLNRSSAPMNAALETALIAVQELLYGGDPSGASLLLDELEAVLDSGGQVLPPSIQARLSILDLLAHQDRAILRADADVYLGTIAPSSPMVSGETVRERLAPPLLAYEQELVRLQVAADGRSAEGVVLDHGQVLSGVWDDGALFEVRFVNVDGRWLMYHREPKNLIMAPLPASEE
jgi:hypothetical protein